VRNLPLEADEKLLGKVFMKAARDAVKQQPKDSPLRDGTIGQPVLQQVKLLRSTDRLDAAGAGKSKRYGFVEFSHHEHALLALRALNNNPAAFANAEIKSGKTARPFVEFALEDARKLLIRQQKMAALKKRKELKEKQQAELAAAAGVAAAKEKNKVRSSEQPRKKPIKPVKPEDAQAGGGKGACFHCGLGGHVAKHCPTAMTDGEEGKTGKANPATQAGKAAGAKRKATDSATAPASSEEQSDSQPASKKSKGEHGKATPPAASSGPAASATPSQPARTKKNKNNKHKDIEVPSHLRDGAQEEKQFEQLVKQHKQKFFGADPEKTKAAASRWFD
jgi:RNA recognition motif-containing protein